MTKELKSIDIQYVTVTRSEYLTFLICVVISLCLIFLNDNPQINNVRAAVVDTWATTLQTISKYRSMAEMRKELSRLREHTSYLLLENSSLRKAALENHRLREMLNFKTASPYNLIAASVITRDQDQLVRSVTIDAGTAEGVAKGDPVILPAGIVGKVLRTGKVTSIVQLISDHNFRGACKIQKSRVTGIFQRSDSRTSLLSQVPKNADVRKGDVIVTSGYSHTLPPELLVARVKSTNKEAPSLFQIIEVEPFVDVGIIEDVFIAKSKAVSLEKDH